MQDMSNRFREDGVLNALGGTKDLRIHYDQNLYSVRLGQTPSHLVPAKLFHETTEIDTERDYGLGDDQLAWWANDKTNVSYSLSPTMISLNTTLKTPSQVSLIGSLLPASLPIDIPYIPSLEPNAYFRFHNKDLNIILEKITWSVGTESNGNQSLSGAVELELQKLSGNRGFDEINWRYEQTSAAGFTKIRSYSSADKIQAAFVYSPISGAKDSVWNIGLVATEKSGQNWNMTRANLTSDPPFERDLVLLDKNYLLYPSTLGLSSSLAYLKLDGEIRGNTYTVIPTVNLIDPHVSYKPIKWKIRMTRDQQGIEDPNASFVDVTSVGFDYGFVKAHINNYNNLVIDFLNVSSAPQISAGNSAILQAFGYSKTGLGESMSELIELKGWRPLNARPELSERLENLQKLIIIGEMLGGKFNPNWGDGPPLPKIFSQKFIKRFVTYAHGAKIGDIEGWYNRMDKPFKDILLIYKKLNDGLNVSEKEYNLLINTLERLDSLPKLQRKTSKDNKILPRTKDIDN